MKRSNIHALKIPEREEIIPGREREERDNGAEVSLKDNSIRVCIFKNKLQTFQIRFV